MSTTITKYEKVYKCMSLNIHLHNEESNQNKLSHKNKFVSVSNIWILFQFLDSSIPFILKKGTISQNNIYIYNTLFNSTDS